MAIVTKNLVQVKVPPGYMIRSYKEKPSTNQYALQTARHISSVAGFAPCWITAQRQTAGRGAKGRQWISQDKGNLYTSLLFHPGCQDKYLSHISLIAGIALYDAVTELSVQNLPGLLLKWPNDLMVGTAKLAGILVETQKNISLHGCFAVIGTGLNITMAPSLPDRATICLNNLGIDQGAAEVLQGLALATDHWLKAWDRGNNFHLIARAWVARAQISDRIIVVTETGKKMLQGMCKGIDHRARLVIEPEDGKQRAIEFNRIEQITLSGRQ